MNYLKVWGCLDKVLLPEPKKRKVGFKTVHCMFIKYAEKSVAYFLVVKSGVLSCNTIIETKNDEFFELVFSLSDKISHERNNENISNEELWRSKRPRKEYFSYGNEASNYFEAISSSDAEYWIEAIKIEIDSIMKSKTRILTYLPPSGKSIGCK